MTHDEAVTAFKGWHPAVVEMISSVPQNLRWGLFVVRPLQSWQRGRIVLIGDAAHGMLPHHGQGANVTIEDAITLADYCGLAALKSFNKLCSVTKRSDALVRELSNAVRSRRTPCCICTTTPLMAEPKRWPESQKDSAGYMRLTHLAT